MASSPDETGAGGDVVPRAEVALVLRYLDHCETGHLAEARACLAAGARHTFPGGHVFDDLADWHADFRSRMGLLRKRDHRVDVCELGDGELVVYVRGRLTGRTVGGAEFDDVRFIDRFVVRDGSIVDQQVWNDLAARGIGPTPQTSR